MRRLRGFSLLEVLAAGAGTVLLMGLLLGAMAGGSRAVARDEGEVASQSQALGAVERISAALRLSHSSSVTLMDEPPALAFLSPDPGSPVAPLASGAFALTSVRTEPLAWRRFLVFYFASAARELRSVELAYPADRQFTVASLHPEWLSTALSSHRYRHRVVARSVEAVHFGRTRPPGVDLDITVLLDKSGQVQETRLKQYVTTRNG